MAKKFERNILLKKDRFVILTIWPISVQSAFFKKTSENRWFSVFTGDTIEELLKNWLVE